MMWHLLVLQQQNCKTRQRQHKRAKHSPLFFLSPLWENPSIHPLLLRERTVVREHFAHKPTRVLKRYGDDALVLPDAARRPRRLRLLGGFSAFLLDKREGCQRCPDEQKNGGVVDEGIDPRAVVTLLRACSRLLGLRRRQRIPPRGDAGADQLQLRIHDDDDDDDEAAPSDGYLITVIVHRVPGK